jgi:hypothetical protein
MIAWAFLDENGCVTRCGQGLSAPFDSMGLAEGTDPEIVALCHLVEGEWVPRPRISTPLITSHTEGTSVVFSGLPTGAIATVIDGEAGEVLDTVAQDAGTIWIELVDPGTYNIEVVGPVPWLRYLGNVQL